jgi:lysophospholipase L1-like esterase
VCAPIARYRSIPGAVLAIMMALSPATALAGAGAGIFSRLKCGPFTNEMLPVPTPQSDPEAVARFQLVNREVATAPHTILFLGDSLTRKWDPAIWQQDFARRGALNAGINGDRTEHLRWRLEHGNLNFNGRPPQAVVLLIGTNDIGRNRSPEIIAESIREILKLLRSRLPAARILLLGVLPRSESPVSRRRYQVREVNRLIQSCADNRHIFYADAGKDALLDPSGRLPRAISPDGVHLSRAGYVRLAARLDPELDHVLDVGPPAADRKSRTRRSAGPLE